MIRAVIDTNVIVSALISSVGNEAIVLLAVNEGLLVPCFSEEILEEYRDVLRRPKFGFAADEVESLLRALKHHGASVDPREVAGVSPDPEDDKFIACAFASAADFIVTGNRKHFPEAKLGGIRVVNAAELLEIITLKL